MNPFININQSNNLQSSEIVYYYKKIENKNQKKLYKTNPNYYSEPVTYNLNSFGYRTYNSLPQDYILTLGCSHTYGTGLHEHERYTNLLENEIGIPVINIGSPGIGINFIMLNLLKLIYSSYPKPRSIICQFPNLERLTIPTKQGNICAIPQNKLYASLFKHEDNVATHSEICYQIILDMLKKEKIKLISFYLWGSLGSSQIEVIDYARDFDHPGPNTNISIKNYILDKL
jgi:hypothetical protein